MSKNDAKEAFQAGVMAVKYSTSADIDGAVAIRRLPGAAYKVKYERVELRKVAKNTRSLTDAYIAKNGHDVPPAFIKYATPIVGDLPAVGRFAGKSPMFMVVVELGYLSGILYKLTGKTDAVLWLYVFNFTLVAIDLGLYLRYRNRPAPPVRP